MALQMGQTPTELEPLAPTTAESYSSGSLRMKSNARSKKDHGGLANLP